DRAPAVSAHPRDYRLCAKELMLEVHVQPLVPIVLGYVLDLVAIVVRRIVDQHVDGPRLLDQGVDAAGGCRDVDEVHLAEPCAAARRQIFGFVCTDVEEGDVRPLPGESFYDARADSRAAA